MRSQDSIRRESGCAVELRVRWAEEVTSLEAGNTHAPSDSIPEASFEIRGEHGLLIVMMHDLRCVMRSGVKQADFHDRVYRCAINIASCAGRLAAAATVGDVELDTQVEDISPYTTPKARRSPDVASLTTAPSCSRRPVSTSSRSFYTRASTSPDHDLPHYARPTRLSAHRAKPRAQPMAQKPSPIYHRGPWHNVM